MTKAKHKQVVVSAPAYKLMTADVAEKVAELTGRPCKSGSVLNATYCGLLVEGKHFIRTPIKQRLYTDQAPVVMFLYYVANGRFTWAAKRA